MITEKNFKHGTYATTVWYCDGIEFVRSNSPKHECGTGWFLSLPNEADAKEEPSEECNLPSWVDKALEKYKRRTS